LDSTDSGQESTSASFQQGNETLNFISAGEYLALLSDYQFLKKDSVHWVRNIHVNLPWILLNTNCFENVYK
jgi:hypothetical protein